MAIVDEEDCVTDFAEVNRVVVFPWHCDQFGHMNIRWYAHHFDDGAFHLWSIYGIDFKELMKTGFHTVVAKTTTNLKKEAAAGDLLTVDAAFTHVGTKSVHMHLRLHNSNTGDLCATQDVVEVFFDAKTRTSAPMPPAIREKIEAVVVLMGD